MDALNILTPEIPIPFGFDVRALAIRTIVEPGDFDADGDVDGSDFLMWQRDQNAVLLSDWQANYGLPLIANSHAVPEPTVAILAISTLFLAVGKQRRQLRAM